MIKKYRYVNWIDEIISTVPSAPVNSAYLYPVFNNLMIEIAMWALYETDI